MEPLEPRYDIGLSHDSFLHRPFVPRFSSRFSSRFSPRFSLRFRSRWRHRKLWRRFLASHDAALARRFSTQILGASQFHFYFRFDISSLFFSFLFFSIFFSSPLSLLFSFFSTPLYSPLNFISTLGLTNFQTFLTSLECM